MKRVKILAAYSAEFRRYGYRVSLMLRKFDYGRVANGSLRLFNDDHGTKYLNAVGRAESYELVDAGDVTELYLNFVCGDDFNAEVGDSVSIGMSIDPDLSSFNEDTNQMFVVAELHEVSLVGVPQLKDAKIVEITGENDEN